MAYSRKRYAPKRRTRRSSPTSWYNKRYSVSASPMQVAQQALRATRYIKGLVNSETQHKDFSYSAGTPVSSTGFVTHLTAVAQDDTSAGRTGNSMLLRNISMRFKLDVNPSVTTNSSVLLMLVKDTQQIGDTTPAITDILTTATPESLLALGTAGRFKVLWRKTYILTNVAGGSSAREVVKYFKIYDHIRYNGTASSDIQKNGHYFIAVSNESTNTPFIAGTSRIGYHDN